MALWESAVLAGLAGGLTMTGTWLGFRWQSREARRGRTEQFAREDRFRLHNERLEAYSAFYLAAGHMRSGMRQLRLANPAASAAHEVHGQRRTLWEAFATVRLIGTDDVVEAASAVLAYATEVDHLETEFDIDHYDSLIRDYVRQARSGLLVPSADRNQETSARTSR
ncbi:hypothetical protein ACIA5G_05105 [Amycolatopsis sp. NPDC051758]|uniref:hypothetical protein n=1 Tax=Amycolatopsis sp. NPDC051758 TaxID=3363935 RepID=UPI0037A05C1B